MCALEELTNITVFWDRYHVPSQTGFWRNVLSDPVVLTTPHWSEATV